jgi:predicted nucleic acid-binding protein
LSISAVNLTEVLYVLARFLGQEKALHCVDKARRVADVVSVDEQIAIDTGILHIRYKLGLADCFAGELAMRTGAALVTADPEFAKLGKQLRILALPKHKQ